MRGHVRQSGRTWAYVLELGNQRVQVCQNLECGVRKDGKRYAAHFWIERKPLESCPKCGGTLLERQERRQRWTRGFATKKAAQEALDDVKQSLRQGTYVKPTKITFGDYLIDVWLPAVRGNVKPSTFLSYETHVERHIKPTLGTLLLKDLSGESLDSFYSQLRSEPRQPPEQIKRRRPAKEDDKAKPKDEAEPKVLPPLSPLTIRKIHATLHKALSDAVRWKRIPRNPAEDADPPKSKSGAPQEMKTWTAKELSAFLTFTRGTRHYPLWLALASTGMRRGEASGLRWSDVDFERARLSIRRNRVSVNYEVKTGTPKNDRSRNISIDPITVAVLATMHKQQKEEKLQRRQAGYVDSGFVFRRDNGEPYHPDLISQAFMKAVKDSGQPRIRLHDLRHTHATLALQAGVHIKVVSERLGHANVGITMDLYSHAIPAMQEEAAAKIAALFMPLEAAS